MSLTIHPNSQKKLAVLQKELPQSLLLTGEPGVGLGTIAKDLAGKNLANLIEPHDSKGQVSHEVGTIAVEVIRQLYEQTRAKQTTSRIIVIDNAERMSPGAQAAFLKLLEEPTEHTHFILTSHRPQLLNSTIRSRVQTVFIEPLTKEQTEAYIDSLGETDTTKRRQLEFLAAGLPAELTRLSRDAKYFGARAEVMADTRDFLTKPAYQKLLIVQKYNQDKVAALQLLDSALAVTRRSLNDKPQPSLVTQLDRLLAARNKIEANCNVRLQLTSLAL